MADYSFVTTWRFRAPIERVWQAIADFRSWPRWWPAIAQVKQIAPGDAEGVGEIVEYTFRTRLPYRLRFLMTTTHARPPTELEGRAVGELEGTGRWRLAAEGEETVVRYFWDVRTTRWWMNLLAPIARPVFAWNHDQVMESGRRGLARWLAKQAAGGTAESRRERGGPRPPVR
jgi:carbon monoxide dehydrogenase subunit G